jgi:hypothetical protein
VLGIAVAVFELELLLAALLGGGAGNEAVRARVAQDRGTELLVDQDARRLARRTLGQRELQPVVDDLLLAPTLAVCSVVSGAEKPNRPFSNEARWSKGRM